MYSCDDEVLDQLGSIEQFTTDKYGELMLDYSYCDIEEIEMQYEQLSAEIEVENPMTLEELVNNTEEQLNGNYGPINNNCIKAADEVQQQAHGFSDLGYTLLSAVIAGVIGGVLGICARKLLEWLHRKFPFLPDKFFWWFKHTIGSVVALTSSYFIAYGLAHYWFLIPFSPICALSSLMIGFGVYYLGSKYLF